MFVQIGRRAFNPEHVTLVEFGSGYASLQLIGVNEPLDFIDSELEAFLRWWNAVQGDSAAELGRLLDEIDKAYRRAEDPGYTAIDAVADVLVSWGYTVIPNEDYVDLTSATGNT